MEGYAEKAALWWSNLVSDIGSEKYQKNRNGNDMSPVILVNCVLQSKPTEKQLVLFRQEHVRIIIEQTNDNQTLTLYTKQFPCPELEHCANYAGIEFVQFPWDCKMTIKDKTVMVKGQNDSSLKPLT